MPQLNGSRPNRTPINWGIKDICDYPQFGDVSPIPVEQLDAPCKNPDGLLSRGISVDTNFLKSHADRCRCLAENADEFTKRRLLDLAAHYDKRVRAAEPSVAARFLKTPLNIKDAPPKI